jgi:hypothetical protein
MSKASEKHSEKPTMAPENNRSPRIPRLAAVRAPIESLGVNRLPGPIPKVTSRPVELHSVGRSVLVFCLEALTGSETQRQVAVRMLKEELASGISRGSR